MGNEGGNGMTAKEFVAYLIVVLMLFCSTGVTYVIHIGFGAPLWTAFLFGAPVFYILLRLSEINKWIESREE